MRVEGRGEGCEKGVALMRWLFQLSAMKRNQTRTGEAGGAEKRGERDGRRHSRAHRVSLLRLAQVRHVYDSYHKLVECVANPSTGREGQ